MVNIQDSFKQMLFDILHVLKMAVTTKMGIAIILLCAFIYFTSLMAVGGFRPLTLVLTLVSIFGFFIMSFLTWFRDSSSK